MARSPLFLRAGAPDTRRSSKFCNIAHNIILLDMRIVLDTDVLVAAFRSERGASRVLLIGALDERFVLLASTALGWSTKRC